MSYEMTDTSRPLDPSVRVRDGLREYLGENGFSAAEYTASTVRLKILGRYMDFPNTKDRQWAIPLHDLHHIATGYGTDWVGEGEIGAWELGAGCKTLVVYWLNAMAASIGLCLAPRRVLAGWRAGRAGRALYRTELPYERVLDMTIGELRAHLGVPPTGL
ncbi:MAG: hypothetical protein R3F14_38055, partial [Polyangiaceae bacterium]